MISVVKADWFMQFLSESLELPSTAWFWEEIQGQILAKPTKFPPAERMVYQH